MKVQLNDKTKSSIFKKTGLSVEEIITMDIEDIDNAIEKRIGKKLTFPNKQDPRLIGRGSVYLSLNRFFSFNQKKMNNFIDSISIE